MVDLKNHMKSLKAQLVDLDFLVNFYSIYSEYYNSGDSASYKKLQSLSIPLANSYLSRSNNRFAYEGGEEVFEELFSYSYLMLISILEKRHLHFPDVQQFYSYFDKRIVLGIHSFYVAEYCNKITSFEDLEEEILQKEFELSADSFAVLTLYIQIFSSYHKESDFIYQLAHFIIEALLDTSTFKSRSVNKHLTSLNLNPDDASVIILKNRAVSVARCALLFTLNQELDPYEFLKNNGEYYMLDSQFLYVMSLEDKFPGLMELYHSMGAENMKKILLLLEGRQIIFPRIKDFNQIQIYIDAFIEMTNGKSLEDVADTLKMSPQNLKYEFQKRFSGLKNLEHIIDILPQHIKGALA